MTSTAFRIGTSIVLALVVSVTGACESKPCTATVTLSGKVANGTGTDKQAAYKAACRTHCINFDPLLDSKHRVWKAAGGKSSGNKQKDVESVAVLERFVVACEEQCQKQVAPTAAKYQNCEL